jgi:hypothetical protein
MTACTIAVAKPVHRPLLSWFDVIKRSHSIQPRYLHFDTGCELLRTLFQACASPSLIPDSASQTRHSFTLDSLTPYSLLLFFSFSPIKHAATLQILPT